MGRRSSSSVKIVRLLLTLGLIVVPWASLSGATFPGSGFGQIPDSPAGGTTCGDYTAPPLDITFNVSGLTAPLTDVSVSFTSSGLAHSWVGDLSVQLIAPGAAAAKTIFSQTGNSTAATDCGDSSDVTGPYTFTDTAPASPTWWTAAVAAGATSPVPPGSYQATTPGGSGAGGSNTPITPTFAGLSAGQINGTWTLRIMDGGQGDTGAISAASLSLTAGASAQHYMDNDGDGTTDWVVVRNTGGGPTGQITWFTQNSGGAGTSFIPWGIATDFFVPGDYDGDHKMDVAVWRSGAPGSSYWFILNSATSTLTLAPWGQSGDEPTVQGDYNGDGKTDIAVYRGGATAGAQSFWYSLENGTLQVALWGQNGDFPAPGDYDGDHKNDFVIQRNAGGGQARFWRRFASGGVDSVVFGTPTDVIVPGDYDGDGKTDIATVRGVSGQINWFYLPSSGGSYVQVPFGLSASDFPVQGDYDGDGKTDIAVWRPNADPNLTFFFVLKSSTGTVQIFHWGQNGDYPVANYNTH